MDEKNEVSHPPRIATERLLIKPLSRADARAMLEYRGDASAMRYQSFAPRSLDDVERFIEASTSRFNVENEWFQLGVLHGGILVGDIGIHFLGPDNSTCEIGYTVHPKFQKLGFGRESVRAVVDFLFRGLGKRRVIAVVDSDNIPSAALLRNVGFTFEAQGATRSRNGGNSENLSHYELSREKWAAEMSLNGHLDQRESALGLSLAAQAENVDLSH